MEAGIFGVDLRTCEPQFFLSASHGSSREHEDLVGKEDAIISADKDDELIAIQCLEFASVHVPSSFFTRLVETELFLFPHEKG